MYLSCTWLCELYRADKSVWCGECCSFFAMLPFRNANPAKKESQLHWHVSLFTKTRSPTGTYRLVIKIYHWFGLLFQAPMWWEIQLKRSYSGRRWRSSRERTPEYWANSKWGRSSVTKWRSEGSGHYRPFWWGSLSCPKMKKGEAKIMCGL